MDFVAAYEALSSIKKKSKRKNASKAYTDPKTNAIQKKTSLMIGETQYNYHQVIGHHELSQQIPRKPDGKKGSRCIADALVQDFILKPRLASQWMQKNVDAANPDKKKGMSENPYGFSTIQHLIFPTINAYQDLLISSRLGKKSFPLEISSVLTLHLLNHVLKSRDIIVKNNNKIKLAGIASKQRRDEQMIKHAVLEDTKPSDAKYDDYESERKRKKRRLERKSQREKAKQEKFEAVRNADPEQMPTKLIESDDDGIASTLGNGNDLHSKSTSRSETLGNLRDQGFTRPKVLILVPVRASVEELCQLDIEVLAIDYNKH